MTSSHSEELGRSHRANQVSAPMFQLVISKEIISEYRFASAVAARISSLGALTKGDRRATGNAAEGGGGVESFELNSKYAQEALSLMRFNILRKKYDKNCSLKIDRMPEFLLTPESHVEGQKAEVDTVEYNKFLKTAVYCLTNACILDAQGNFALGKGPKLYQKFLNRLFEVSTTFQRNIFEFFDAHYKQCMTTASDNTLYGTCIF